MSYLSLRYIEYNLDKTMSQPSHMFNLTLTNVEETLTYVILIRFLR